MFEENSLEGQNQEQMNSFQDTVFMVQGLKYMKIAQENQIESYMIPDLPQKEQVQNYVEIYDFERRKQNSLFVMLYRCEMKRLTLSIVFQIIGQISKTLNLLVAKYFLNMAFQYQIDFYTKLSILILLVFIRIVAAFIQVHANNLSVKNIYTFFKQNNKKNTTSAKLQAGIQALLFKKTMKMCFLTNYEFDQSKLIVILQQDVTKIGSIYQKLGEIIALPVQTTVNLILIIKYFGVYSTLGILVILISLVLNFILGKYYNQYQKQFKKENENRIGQLKIFLNNCKFYKLNNFEYLIEKQIAEAREQELNSLKRLFKIRQIQQLVLKHGQGFSLCFILYFKLLVDGTLDPAAMIVLIGLANQLSNNFQAIPDLYSVIIDYQLSAERYQETLNTEERNLSYLQNQNFDEEIGENIYWQEEGLIFSKLSNNQLSYASGKSSLFSIFNGEMFCQQPYNQSLQYSGKLYHVTQMPWIMSKSLKQNICFNKPFDKEKFDKVVQACSLESDLKILVNQENTMIGEKGITLSGGQKGRISLARAVYNDADIYLMDDVFSQFDMNVQQEIIEKCINGLLKNKTIILCSNQQQCLALDGKFYKMKEGELLETQSDQNDDLQTPQNMKSIQQQKKTQKNSEKKFQKKTTKNQFDDLITNEEQRKGEINLEVVKYYFKEGGCKKFG